MDGGMVAKVSGKLAVDGFPGGLTLWVDLSVSSGARFMRWVPVKLRQASRSE